MAHLHHQLMQVKLWVHALAYLRNMTQVNVLPALSAVTQSPVDRADVLHDRTALSQGIERLQLLDDPGEWADFSLPEKDMPGCWRSTVVFEGMHCAACAITLEDALRSVPGVSQVQISGASHRGQIVWTPEITRPSEWMRLSLIHI